jgi:predicted chitinase
MPINRSFFLSQSRLTLFDGAMSAAQKAGLSAILDRWEAEMPAADDRWLAYMLGTAHHETGRTMQAVRETFAASDDQAIARLNRSFNAGRLPWVRTPYWHKDAAGKSWLGRGLVQITHKTNYQKLGTLIGVDLVADPGRAMSLPVAIAIMFTGMTRGSFTGKKLADYFQGSRSDWRNARRIINGTERAELVASYARQYYAAISYTTG